MIEVTTNHPLGTQRDSMGLFLTIASNTNQWPSKTHSDLVKNILALGFMAVCAGTRAMI